jgi:hypothetical protein
MNVRTATVAAMLAGSVICTELKARPCRPVKCLIAVSGHAFGQYDDGKMTAWASKLTAEPSLGMPGRNRQIPHVLATRIAVQ